MMPIPTEELIEAARAVRPYLEDLLATPELAQEADGQLAQVLALPDTEAAGGAQEILMSAPLRAWTLEFVRLGAPEDLFESEGLKGLQPLPGQMNRIRAPRYRCPAGNDYVWYRRTDDHPIPRCPTHQVRLVLDPRARP